MKELHHENGAFNVDDQIAEALERLAVALAKNRMSAIVKLQPLGEGPAVEFTLGIDRKGAAHPLRARSSSTDETSRLGMEEI